MKAWTRPDGVRWLLILLVERAKRREFIREGIRGLGARREEGIAGIRVAAAEGMRVDSDGGTTPSEEDRRAS